MKTIVDEQIEAYQDQFLIHGPKIESTFQNNQETQYLRFERMIAPLKPYLNTSFTIHDVGSGLADLHQFLNEYGYQHDYSGTEIVPGMIDASQKRFPEVTIFGDAITDRDTTKESYNFVVASGVFNLKANQSIDTWKSYVLENLKRMWEMATCGISFNLLTTQNTFEDETLFYAHPSEILSFCSSLSRHIVIDQSYPLYEFNATVLRSETLFERYRQEEKLVKYLT